MSNADREDQERHKARIDAITLQHLRFAVTASDAGSLRKAAHFLAVRHSILSRAIGQFEHLVGAALFERSSGGVRPTPAGRDVLRIARFILEQVDVLFETGRATAAGEAGHLAIGFCMSVLAGNLRATLLEFKRCYPEVEITTVERSHSHLLNALQNGTLDVVIASERLASTAMIRVLPLWSERILISLPANHELATREVIYSTDLRDQSVLLSPQDPGRELEELLISKLLLCESRPKIERHEVSRSVVKSLVSMGLGVTLALESDFGATTLPGLTYRELRDGTGSSRIGFSARWRTNNENPALANFLKLLSDNHTPPVGEGQR
ncbi:LysR substrate-binding domain-containing protein [Bradyrhizobium erythrophlei]|uniref:LysR family transcriptional regulator n=1 Tax=Bradyrhizobium erythrophlei TaxID=1437360 RepID=UPI0035E838DE